MAGSSKQMPDHTDTIPTNTPDQFSFKNATFEEVLEELSSRFILNLPEDELAEVERVCFQVEQAHWYYEDFIRDEKPSFPSLPLKKFSEILFRSCPLLHHWSHDHETAFNGFMNYKTRVPVCGAIMLNEALTKCVLVKGWKASAGWSFPKGKVNENEDEAFCAVREVLEETGYNLSGQIRRTNCIKLCIKQQPITLFVVSGVPEDFPFKTQTRKEISKIDWFNLSELPLWKKSTLTTHKFYLIAPVIIPLKTIVRDLRKERKAARHQLPSTGIPPDVSTPGASNRAAVDNIVTNVAADSPLALEPSSAIFSGEAGASSSQSSSIDPHTPSVHGDFVPSSSPDLFNLVLDSKDPPSQLDIRVSSDLWSYKLGTDPGSHWTRLMTRLNHSEEVSPWATSQTSTPTPTTAPVPNPTVPESQTKGFSNPLALATSSVQYINHQHAGASSPHTHSSIQIIPETGKIPETSNPLSSEPSKSNQGLTSRSGIMASTSNTTCHSPDALARRAKQLKLLDEIIAEDSAKDPTQPPKSAHIFGAYSQVSDTSLPQQICLPIRSASVNPHLPRSSTTASHRHTNHSISTFPGVLPIIGSVPSQHQQVHHLSPQRYLPQRSLQANELTTNLSRSASGLLPQSYLASSATARPTLHGGNTTNSVHRGQMLSILSGGIPFSRPLMNRPPEADSLPSGTLYNSGNIPWLSLSRPLICSKGYGSCPQNVSPTAVVESTIRNAHLLSILNNPSATGRVTPATTLVRMGP